MRWCTLALGLALTLVATEGCKQQCFLSECDYQHYHALGLTPALECDPAASAAPAGPGSPPPPTVQSPERRERYLSLAEAIAIALEQGTVGSPLLNGTTNDSLVTFQGRVVNSLENNIRVLALEPAIVGTDIETSLSKFDARWITSMSWNTIDQPVASALQTVEAAGTVNTIRTNDATLNSTLLKPLPTGGVAGITFRTDYEFTNLPARVNPFYRPFLQFQFDQPLLQAFGVEINELRATHPGVTPPIPGFVPPGGLLPFFNTGGRVEGILITRLRFDQERAEFERQVHQMVTNVEVAYWDLYGAYWNLYSREQALVQAYWAWQINQQRRQAGTISEVDVAQTLGQYELFRGQRIDALNQVLENEHQLRGLLGLPVDDCTRLVPIDAPTLAPFRPDWDAALCDALALRPELVLARQDLKFRQLDLINQKNQLLPDLRFTSTYDINGIGPHLGGGGTDPNNALHSLASDQFHDWGVGLRLDVPLGFREAHAGVRGARLRLAQSLAVLRDQENKTRRFLGQQYRFLFTAYEEIQAQRAQRQAHAVELEGRFKDFLEGRGTLDFLLESQRLWADALRNEFAAVAEYNNALARFEFAKGTILERDNVYISEGALPHCAQVRAVEHEKQRSDALVLRERARPVPAASPGAADGYPGLPQLPDSAAPSLPALFEGLSPAPPRQPELLPTPRPVGQSRPEELHLASARGVETAAQPPAPSAPALAAVQLTHVEATEEAGVVKLAIFWTTGKNLACQPMALSYADNDKGPWMPIAPRVENTGRYEWKVPPVMPPQFYVRIEARDPDGRLTGDQTPEPIPGDWTQVKLATGQENR